MLALVEIVHIYFWIFFISLFKARRDLQRQNCSRQNSARFREYLHENEFLSKTILAYLSGAQMASIHEIKNG